MGVTFAILRLFGKIPDVNDWLIMVVTLRYISSVNNKSSEKIPSCPLLVKLFVFLIMRRVVVLSIRAKLLSKRAKSKITIISSRQIISKM